MEAKVHWLITIPSLQLNCIFLQTLCTWNSVWSDPSDIIKVNFSDFQKLLQLFYTCGTHHQKKTDLNLMSEVPF